MVGSDWPVVAVSASCDEWFSLVDGVAADLSPTNAIGSGTELLLTCTGSQAWTTEPNGLVVR